jgi:hypothetical protein
MAESPQPGIYEGVPFETYLTWPYLSNSRLSAADRSLLHFKEQEPIEETAPMRFGTLCHTGRLEPSAIYRRYVVMPDLTQNIVLADGSAAKNPRATKEYGQRVEAWKAQQADKLVVSQDEFDSMVGVVSALDADPVSRAWFASEGPTELSIVWDDPDTGLRLKGRIDKLATRLQVLADLKTTRDCQRFPTQIAERKYHRQGAMYLNGWEVLTGEVYRFGLAAVENLKPFGVMSALVREADVEQGHEEFKAMLRRVADAQRSGIWPGYTSPDEWALPAWAKSETSESVTLTFGGAQLTL